MSRLLVEYGPAIALVVLLIAAPMTFLLQSRVARLIAIAAALLELVLAFLMAAEVSANGPIRYLLGGWGAPLGIEFKVDGLSVVMIALTAVVGLGVTVYANGYFSDKKRYRFFWPLWLFMWASLVALFSVNDAFNYYVCLELVSMSAISLVALAGGRPAIVAAMRYLFAAVGGSLLYLFGVGMIYAGSGALDLTVLAEQANTSTITQAGLALAMVGLIIKTALVPMHFWLPPAHANAVTPVSAVLSALVVKGSFFILVRLAVTFGLGSTLPGAPLLLGALGATAIVWGSLQALSQRRLKLLVAYSTVAQIGYLFILFPLLDLASTPDQAAGALGAGLFHAVSHALAKSAMFLAAGSVLSMFGHDRIAELGGLARKAPAQAAAFALAGVSMLGLPPSGGFVSKWLYVNTALDTGQWWWAAVVLAGGLLAALYVFKVVGVFMRTPSEDESAVEFTHSARSMSAVPLVLAFASLFVGLLSQPVLDLLLPAARALFMGGM